MVSKIGWANSFAEHKTWIGPCEADFLFRDGNFKLNVVHALQGPHGMDVGECSAQSATPSVWTSPRQPQETILRYPYVFRDRTGMPWLTGVRDPNHGHSWAYQWINNQWDDYGSNQPILYQATSGPWSEIYNNPVIDFALFSGWGERKWLAAPEIAGGTGLAMGTDMLSLTKSNGVVIPNAGNGCLDNFRDEYCILWAGLRDNNWSPWGHNIWFTTFFSAKWIDLVSNINNPNNWTCHKASFAIGQTGIHICDPAVIRMGNRTALMVSYNQAGMKFFEGPELDRIYADCILGV